jgi:hypothetical protein
MARLRLVNGTVEDLAFLKPLVPEQVSHVCPACGVDKPLKKFRRFHRKYGLRMNMRCNACLDDRRKKRNAARREQVESGTEERRLHLRSELPGSRAPKAAPDDEAIHALAKWKVSTATLRRRTEAL